MSTWEFEKDSALNVLSSADCREIFFSFCHELGKYYSGFGGKFAKSGPHITFEEHGIKLQLCFASSGSNVKGSYVNLELLPKFYSKSVKAKKGYIWGHPGVFQLGGESINNNFNLYDNPVIKFQEVTDLINHKVLPVLDIMSKSSTLLAYLSSVNERYYRFSVLNNAGLKEFIGQFHGGILKDVFPDKGA